MNKKWIFCISTILFLAQASIAQNSDATDYAQTEAATELQWQHADATADGIPGTSAKRAYAELLNGKKSTPVVVAIIDSGTESFHPDLKDNIWTNSDEIEGNGKDDDNNGYVDDVHGWSFIGGPTGDVSDDNLEFTRIYRDLKKRFEKQDVNAVSASDKKDFERYQKMKTEYARRYSEAKDNKETYDQVKEAYDRFDKQLKKSLGNNYSNEDLEKFSPTAEEDIIARQIMLELRAMNLPEDFKDWKEQVESMIFFHLNLNFDPRNLVGDNYSNVAEKNYGNNHIDGPHADHGTHVGGIVGAVRNGYGIDGIADNVQLMIIRCVPNGDERDKDVANAIRYAVDNGARIINMSFGKSFSPQKEAVDAAVKYAEQKGVLLVHAAGNDGKNLENAANFPTDKYNDGSYCSTWIEIGASDKNKENLAASFSNYGKKSVDVFSPGVAIFSTVPDGKYQNNDGTSMAAPVVAGVAAALLSYYPELTASDLKAILIQSSEKYRNQKVLLPGSEKKKVKFKKLSVSGGVVNLYNAVKLAETWKPGSAK
ncbi:MAG: S8 family serine peptidase [Flavobacteriales bacterium]